MDHIWVLSYSGDLRISLEQWYFSTEEKAKEAMKDLAPGRLIFQFHITKGSVDTLYNKVD
jgi:hypothetical protein